MRSFDLLVGREDAPCDLNSFAREFFALIGVDDFRERDSSHYVNGNYYVGSTNEVSFQVMLHDDPEHADLPFWIEITPKEGKEFDLHSLVGRTLLASGHKVAEVLNFGLRDEKRRDF